MSSSPKFGLEPVPRSLKAFLSSLSLHEPTSVSPVTTLQLSSLATSSSPLSQTTLEFVRKVLPEPTLQHSFRVYYLGIAMVMSNPALSKVLNSIVENPEVYFLSSLLHDIGTTEENLKATGLSFEYYGGIVAREWILKNEPSAKELADSVAETIIRHQDIGERGMISGNTQLIQMATMFDNIGANQHLVATGLREEIYKAHPRGKWSSCFAGVIHKECELKPYCSTTRLGDVTKRVMENPLNALEM